MVRERLVIWAAGLGLAALPGLACAEQLVVQTDAGKLALEPYASPIALGGRALLSANLGAVDTSLNVSVERGGGLAQGGDAWTEVYAPSSWVSDDVNLGANWTLASNARISVEAGDRERWTRNFANPLVSTGDAQLAMDGARYLRLRAGAQAEALDLQLGAETTTTELDTHSLGGAASATHLWLTSQRVFANLAWRPTEKLKLEAGQSEQSFSAGWRGGSEVGAQDAYLTPSLALTVTPWSSAQWRILAEQTLAPIDPAKFAAYAQIATPGAGQAPQPDRGWRYGLRLDHRLPGGITLSAEADDWRLANVTELGPVGAGEAPISIGPAQRQQLAFNVGAPLSPLGLGGARVDGEVSLRWSQVADPFTGQRRAMSGETPYRARLRLAGALPAPDLSWSLTAQADGPQSIYQLAQVTNLGATAGLGGALSYGAGPLRVSLEVDNLVGGERAVTTLSYNGPRTEDSLSNIARRRDEARAVRLAFRRGL